ncbi:Sec-independent protein translocase TatB [Arthrobacter sp. APC 3897]|uniref:Sec-independent protein translocase TatB n=1 Tax=Arthrobacter sp. APC 3897 TaxID=3035204 RepID=UPI0025B467F1|nr:Sec-independent protein translocase TatB [Arthrobacter sp. APC 3897]MDN3482248.1 Sec-independent protein translocase TatB [Arthrobacter sp. APC 3897]
MIGINGYELLVLAILAVAVLGPERLPEYASQLARLVREVRRMATGAREQLREEVGPEIDEVDWRKLDPRQYDPRRIIKEALLDDFEDAVKPVSARPAPAAPQATAAGPGADRAAASNGAPAVKPLMRLQDGDPAPFDTEAT